MTSPHPIISEEELITLAIVLCQSALNDENTRLIEKQRAARGLEELTRAPTISLACDIIDKNADIIDDVYAGHLAQQAALKYRPANSNNPSCGNLNGLQ